MLRTFSARHLIRVPHAASRWQSAPLSSAAEAGGGGASAAEASSDPPPRPLALSRPACPYELPGEARPHYPKRRSPFARAKALINSLHEEEGLRMLASGRAVFPQKVPDPQAGDIMTVTYAPDSRRPTFTQRFTGICISVRRRGLGSAFVLRNVLDGVPVERSFPFYSPGIRDVEITGRRKVARNKLYYLRDRKLRESTFQHKTKRAPAK